jgi:hypothetical protein
LLYCKAGFRILNSDSLIDLRGIATINSKFSEMGLKELEVGENISLLS